MNGSGFAIGQIAIKDLTDADLAKAADQLAQQMQQVGNQLNQAVQQMQLSTAMLNVVRYEIDRRANSIQLARILPPH